MRKNGFTLIEVIIAMTVGLIIMAAVYGFMSLVQKNSANADRKIVTLQDTRGVLDLMAMEIRMASYNPRGLNSTWSNPSPLACMPSTSTTYKGIKQADANNIAVAMDLNADGVIGCTCGACCGPPNTCTDPTCAGTNEYIVYSYDGTVGTLYRNVNCSVNSAILGGTAAPYSNVRNTVNGVTIVPLFQYYDGTNTLLTAPINIPAIRRILITIVADTADIDLNTKQPKRIVYSTSVMVRNHALN